MTPHHLGLELRQLVLRNRSAGLALDTRRLQAAIVDLCGGEHGDLVAPLRYLVLSAPFASAAGQDPPLGDPRLLGRLQQELAQMYAAPLCQRLQPLLEGLLGLAPTSDGPAGASENAAAGWAPAAAGMPVTPPPIPSASAPGVLPTGVRAVPPAAAQPASAALGRASSGLNVVLAFLSGLLLMALAGIGLWQLQRPQQSTGSTPSPAAVPPTAGAPQASTAPEAATGTPRIAASETSAPVAPGDGHGSADETAAVDRALASVNALYDALSAKDYSRARDLFGPGAADQFEPAFFDQFERVSVQDLRLTSRTGSNVNLEGVVSFIYPDGTIQTETRTFTLDGSSDTPRITASEFGRVIKPR